MSRKQERDGKRVLPGLWQLNKTTWVVRAQRQCPHSGRKLNRRRVVNQATRQEALNALASLQEELEQVVSAPPAPAQSHVSEQHSATNGGNQPMSATSTPRTTLADFASSWLQTKQDRKDLASSTAKRYATALDRLSKFLKQRPLCEVTRKDIEQWMVAALGSYEPVTINGWLTVLRACMAEAVKDRLIDANPACAVNPLKVTVNLEETNSLSPELLTRLLRALAQQDHTIHAAAWTQAMTGLRWGEVSALKWKDYDTARSVLRIRRSVCDGELVPFTKTEKARVVGVPQILAGTLDQHRAALLEKGIDGEDEDLMFPSRVGTPLRSGRISDALRAACETAGIRVRFTSHGFRRSLTDLLRNAEVDPVVAAGLTGHETARMRKHYSTVRDAEALDASERVAKLVRLSSESSEESTQESSDPSQQKGQFRKVQ